MRTSDVVKQEVKKLRKKLEGRLRKDPKTPAKSMVDFLNDFKKGVLADIKEIDNDIYFFKKKIGASTTQLQKQIAFTKAINTLVATGHVDVAWDLLEEVVAQWDSLPKGWSMKSLHSMWAKLGGSDGSVSTCIEKMTGKVSDAGAFCASLKDKATGTTEWRGED